MDINEALYTTRAMRRVKPDPIPDDALQAMLDAAIRAPSAGNAQDWRFVVVSDVEQRRALGELYAQAWKTLVDTFYRERLARADDAGRRVLGSAQWLADNAGQVPLWVLFFSRNDPTGGSIFPAAWSLMLSARAHGIGTTLTTVLGVFQAAAVFDLLDVPADKGWHLNAAIPCGYPQGRWGVASRRPVHEVTYHDRWANPLPWTIDEPLWSGD